MPEAEEHWKTIPGFPNYAVSDMGNVRVTRNGKTRLLKLRLDHNGYPTAGLFMNGRHTWKKVHRIVLEVFVGSRPEGYECDHANTIRTDNRLENLKWVTKQENKRNPITRERYKKVWERKMRGVLCVDTGETFPSVTEAAHCLGLRRSLISSVLCGYRARTGGLRFVYTKEVRHA